MRATARRNDGLAHAVEVDGHNLVVDEPLDAGGTDSAPSPTRLLAASLASCTAITIAMYADRKEWDTTGLAVDVDFEGAPAPGDPAHFDVSVTLPPGLDEEQRRRIMVVAAKCPVHRILASESEIELTERSAG